MRRSASARLLIVGLLVVLSACTSPATTPPPITGPPPTIVGTVTAGPVCPVERASPDPSCAPRPVGGAVIVVSDAATGAPVGQSSTAADGTYTVIVAETGTVLVTGLPVKGLLGTPAPVTVTLAPATETRVDLVYDTGIR